MAHSSITKIVNHLSCFKMELRRLKEKSAVFEKQMKIFLLPHALTSTNKLVPYNKLTLLKSDLLDRKNIYSTRKYYTVTLHQDSAF